MSHSTAKPPPNSATIASFLCAGLSVLCFVCVFVVIQFSEAMFDAFSVTAILLMIFGVWGSCVIGLIFGFTGLYIRRDRRWAVLACAVNIAFPFVCTAVLKLLDIGPSFGGGPASF